MKPYMFQTVSLSIIRSFSLYTRSGIYHTDRPDHEHNTTVNHDTKVKPEAATAVIELLMMGGKSPETC
jgi:hypothetical protein